jgi:hypothetical protein
VKKLPTQVPLQRFCGGILSEADEVDGLGGVDCNKG